MIYKPRSEYALNVGRLSISGIEISPDEFNQTLLMNDRPIIVPGGYNGVILASEAGMPLPHFYSSVLTTGLTLTEEYIPSAFMLTGWGVFCASSGTGPLHLSSGISGVPLYNPLTGSIYQRSPTGSAQRIVAPFTINSGMYYNEGAVTPIEISGDTLLGFNLYSGLSGMEDLSVVLFGNYYDVTPANSDDGVVMSSGDSSIAFYSQCGYTGLSINEYYNPHDFVATRWSVYASQTGSSPLDPAYPDQFLSGRFYYRSPHDTIKTTITNFKLETGKISNFSTFDDFVIPWRKIVGMDIYRGMNNARNLNFVLGGSSISSASYFKSIITSEKFLLFSGAITGMITDAIVGVSQINGAYGALNIAGGTGMQVRTEGSNLYIDYSGNAFDPHAYDLVTTFDTGHLVDSGALNSAINFSNISGYNDLTGASGLLVSLIKNTSGVLHYDYTGLIYSAVTGLQDQIPIPAGAVQSNLDTTGAYVGGQLNLLSGVLSGVIASGYKNDLYISGITFNKPSSIDGYYFFTPDDANKMIIFTGSNSITGIIGPNSLYSFNTGDYISIIQSGLGEYLISGSGSCSLNSRGGYKKINGQYGFAEAVYYGNDIWFLHGDLIA